MLYTATDRKCCEPESVGGREGEVSAARLMTSLIST